MLGKWQKAGWIGLFLETGTPGILGEELIMGSHNSLFMLILLFGIKEQVC